MSGQLTVPGALTTDLYEVGMALAYLRDGMTGEAVFGLFVRKLPPRRGFLVAAGLESALSYLEGLRVGHTEAAAFAEALHRPVEDLEPLVGLEFTGEVRAVPEGRIVFAGEPLLEVRAPLPQAQLAETSLLNLISHQTAVASKAARCRIAAAGRPVVDFSLRRTQGVEAGLRMARLGALVGFAGTSNVAAATAYGIPAVGTMAHSFVEAYEDEEAAFRAFARAHPGPVTFLVDTYDTEEGVATAARVLRDLGHVPGTGCGVRLDSGDLGDLAVRARRILDAAGLGEVRIVASGGLDEDAIEALVRSGAPVDVYAVGTRVGVSADAPYLDSAYKLAVYDGRPVMKLSAGKVTAPGAKQVFRGPGLADTVGLWDEAPPPGTEPLLGTVMSGGHRVAGPAPLPAVRERFEADLAALPEEARRIADPVAPRPAVSGALAELTERVRHRIERRVFGGRAADG
ncbi:nicotinate phosphoribosyltransferase [Streptomyces glaucosporus]|uniref:Nicotinate phosphoribosyltransferase n=1 Tax=Streptomyces glaucosporus TaxID=284044 RepID=A0ABP5VND9_9ACTN